MKLTALPAFLGWDYCWHQEWQADGGKPRIVHLNFLLGFLCFKITLYILFHSDLTFHHTPLHHASYFMAHCLSPGLYAYLSFLPPSLGVRVSEFWKGRSGHVAL